jgi:hypothetical protein
MKIHTNKEKAGLIKHDQENMNDNKNIIFKVPFRARKHEHFPSKSYTPWVSSFPSELSGHPGPDLPRRLPTSAAHKR